MIPVSPTVSTQKTGGFPILGGRPFVLAPLALLLAGGIWAWGALPGWARWSALGLAGVLGVVSLLPAISRSRLARLLWGLHAAWGVFLALAAVGVWAAYDRPSAVTRFGLLAIAVLLGSSLARQPRSNLWPVARLLAALGGGLAAYFLLTYNWVTEPVKIEAVNRLGRLWMAGREVFLPVQILPALDADLTAGVLLALAPLAAAAVGQSWQTPGRRWGRVLAGGLVLGLILVVIFLSAERAPWVGLVLLAGVWLLFNRVDRLPEQTRGRVLWGAAGLAVGLGLVLIAVWPAGLDGLINLLPGPSQTASRAEIWRNSLFLVGDFPFTGGGLASFPGLYSQYILVIPFDYLENSHSMFLETAIEQGLPGLLALLAVWLASFGSLLAARVPHELQPLRRALLGGGAALTLHGLVENALYGHPDALFLFLTPGLAAAVAFAGNELTEPQPRPRRGVWIAGAALAVGLVVLSMLPAVRAAWWSNLGAVKLARAELQGFPRNQWQEKQDVPVLAPAIPYFERALDVDPQQCTAHSRLGHIALLNRDFPTAVRHFESAVNSTCTSHPGIRKMLGTSYTWVGDIDRAFPLVTEVPDAAKEMENYRYYWAARQRDDLAAYALQMLERLSQNIEK